MQKRRGRSVGQLSLILIASSVPVAAQAGEGFYAGLTGGGNFLEDQKYRLDDSSVFGKASFKDGWAAGLVFGYATESGLRPELEILHRQNDFDGFHLESTGALNPARDATNVDGKQSAQTAMANLWLDLFPKSWVHPYAGFGVGAARISVDDVGYNAGGLLNPRVEFGDDDITTFAYQVGAGVGFDLGDHLTLSLDYRYLQTQRKKIDLNSATSRFDFKYETQTALLTLRYAFGGPAEEAPPPPAPPVDVVPVVEAAPPPPPPPPPPCESPKPGVPFSLEGCAIGQTLVLHGVNFEFDKSRLTVNAKTLLDLVADALTARQDIRVEIAGHTDSKGADSYNQKLSESRADSVKLYLVERGIANDRMTTIGYGESQPVADNTTDEGRELNRRVELRVTASDAAAGPAPTVASPVPEGDVPPPPAEPAPAP